MYVHTLEMTYRLNYIDYTKLFEDLAQYCKKKGARFYDRSKKCAKSEFVQGDDGLATLKKTHRYFICEALEEIGVKIGLVNYVCKPTVYFGLCITVNPRKVIQMNNNIDLFDDSELEMLIATFNMKVGEMSINFPEFDEFSLERIDYSYNKFFDGQQKAESIMDIYRRAYRVCEFEEFLKEVKSQKRKLPPKDSIYLKNKSVSINIYLKHKEIIDKRKILDDADRAIGLMRFEIQCKGRKLYNLKEKFKFKNMRVRNFFNENIYQHIFTAYFKKIFGTGHFYKYNDAVKIINSSSQLKNKDRNLMLEFVRIASEKRNINKAINEFQSLGYGENKVKAILKLFDFIGVNAITIPRNYEFSILCNPLSQIDLG